MQVRVAVCTLVICVGAGSLLHAQDAVKADPAHYSVVSENAQLRILKVHYGPHEKSVMHSHPASVAVFLTDSMVTFAFPDGKKQAMTVKAGDAQYSAAMVHLPENTDDKGLDLILVELKGKTAKPGKMEKK